MTTHEPTPEEREGLAKLISSTPAVINYAHVEQIADDIIAAGWRLQRPGEGVEKIEAAVKRLKAALQYLDESNDERAEEGEQPCEELDVLANDIRAILSALFPAPVGEKEAVEESEIADLLERARHGEALTAREQSAWTGYELGWRDGHNALTAERDAALAEAGRMREAIEATVPPGFRLIDHDTPKDRDIRLWPAVTEKGVIPVTGRWYRHLAISCWITDAFDCGDYEFEPTHWAPVDILTHEADHAG